MQFAPQTLRTYFTTFSTHDRRRLFQVASHAELLVAVLMDYRAQGRFELHSYVVMPDHVHLLLTPAPDVSLEKSLQYVRGGFSFRLKSKLPVWKRGHFDKRVPNMDAYEACVRYIQQNPVLRELQTATKIFPIRRRASYSTRCRRGCKRPSWAESPSPSTRQGRGLKPAATPRS